MRLLKLTTILLALLSKGCAPACAATYSFFTPAQTTNVVNGLITAGTFGSAAFNANQFITTPFSYVVIRNGALTTNQVLTTPTLTTPVGSTVAWTGGTNSALALLSCTTPGLTGFLYGNGTSAITVNVVRDDRILWMNTIRDLPSIAANDFFDITFALTAASTASTVSVNADAGGHTNIMLFAWADATNSVTVRAVNRWTAAVDAPSATWRVTVINHNN